MTRSRKKTPITGITIAESDKGYKKIFHQASRSRVRTLLKSGEYEHAEYDKPYDDWSAPKDGKRYWTRDVVEKMPELIRK